MPAFDDLSARLSAALQKSTAKSSAPIAAAAPPGSIPPGMELSGIIKLPGGAPAPPPPDDFNARLAQAMDRSRPPEPAQETAQDAATPATGPVGAGDFVVRDGDCMASIAVHTGFFWQTLWNESANAELQQIRKDPYCLLPGDRVTIPELRQKQESCTADQRHRFKRKGAPEVAAFVFKVQDEPRANEAYELPIDGVVTTGTSTPTGRVEFFIPPDAKQGEILFVESGDRYVLRFGRLDPLSEL